MIVAFGAPERRAGEGRLCDGVYLVHLECLLDEADFPHDVLAKGTPISFFDLLSPHVVGVFVYVVTLQARVFLRINFV